MKEHAADCEEADLEPDVPVVMRAQAVAEFVALEKARAVVPAGA